MAINVSYFVENIPFSEKKENTYHPPLGIPSPPPVMMTVSNASLQQKKMDFRFRHLCFFTFLTFSAINIQGEHHYIAFFAQIRR